MKRKTIFTVASFLLLASASLCPEASKGYKVIVNPSNPLVSISQDNVSRIFLKDTTKFPNGRNASPVDLSVNSTIRDHFSRDIHGKPASAIDAYWQKLIFSGRDVPPPQKSESGALEYVRSNENAIGYVSADADTTGAKVVTVTKY